MIKDIKENFSGLDFFNEESHFFHVFKKTEKIVAALYLVSNILKDKEPIKWTIRERSLSLIASALVVNDRESVDKDTVIRSLISDTVEIISIMDLAHMAGLLSSMNHNILNRELQKLVELIKEGTVIDKEEKGYVLSENFFKEEVKNPAIQSVVDRPITIKKTGRKEMILDLLKTKSNLTVKDVAQVVTNCSEKTIQRELIELVEQGVVKREGERRWSRYSLS